jgi:hypothetical protein
MGCGASQPGSPEPQGTLFCSSNRTININIKIKINLAFRSLFTNKLMNTSKN